jgi:hypothetical protein
VPSAATRAQVVIKMPASLSEVVFADLEQTIAISGP